MWRASDFIGYMAKTPLQKLLSLVHLRASDNTCLHNVNKKRYLCYLFFYCCKHYLKVFNYLQFVFVNNIYIYIDKIFCNNNRYIVK